MLDIVLNDCATVFELLARKDEALFVCGWSPVIFDPALDSTDGCI
jgi:hypothetical protein